MSAIQRISDRVALADVVAFDRDDKPVMVVGASERMIYPEEELASYKEVFGSIRKYIPFAILAFADEMTIYRKHRDRSVEPVVILPTREIIRHYTRETSDDYLPAWFIAAKIRDWLNDLGDHPKSPTPPFLESMTSLGLTERLQGGWSKERVRLACLPERGDQLPDRLRDWAEPRNGHHPLEPAQAPSVGLAEHLPDGGFIGP